MPVTKQYVWNTHANADGSMNHPDMDGKPLSAEDEAKAQFNQKFCHIEPTSPCHAIAQSFLEKCLGGSSRTRACFESRNEFMTCAASANAQAAQDLRLHEIGAMVNPKLEASFKTCVQSNGGHDMLSAPSLSCIAESNALISAGRLVVDDFFAQI